MTFLVQFVHFRRGVPEVSRTLRSLASDATSALAQAQGQVGVRAWPRKTDALRVMDDRGRMLIDWAVPPVATATAQAVRAEGVRPKRTLAKSRPRPPSVGPELRLGSATLMPCHSHVFEVGQSVSYSEDRKPETWRGGYEIIELHNPGSREPQYAIRNGDESFDRIVREHELREDLGARARGR